MNTRGELTIFIKVTPKEQTKVNLSGKKTLVGRNSGECLVHLFRPPTKQAPLRNIFSGCSVSPSRTKELMLLSHQLYKLVGSIGLIIRNRTRFSQLMLCHRTNNSLFVHIIYLIRE